MLGFVFHGHDVANARSVVVMMMFMVVVVMTMMMSVIMMGMATGICTAQRAENCRYIRHRGAEPLEHRLDDMITKNEDAIILDLCRQMPVADMPGEFGYVERIAPANLVEFLACSADFNFASVIQNEPVSVAQHHRLREIDKHLLAAFQSNGFAPQMAFIAFKNGVARRHSIDHLIRTNNGSGTKHLFASPAQNKK